MGVHYAIFYVFKIIWTLSKVEWSPICRIFVLFLRVCVFCSWFLKQVWYNADKHIKDISMFFFLKQLRYRFTTLFPLLFTLLYFIKYQSVSKHMWDTIKTMREAPIMIHLHFRPVLPLGYYLLPEHTLLPQVEVQYSSTEPQDSYLLFFSIIFLNVCALIKYNILSFCTSQCCSSLYSFSRRIFSFW